MIATNLWVFIFSLSPTTDIVLVFRLIVLLAIRVQVSHLWVVSPGIFVARAALPFSTMLFPGIFMAQAALPSSMMSCAVPVSIALPTSLSRTVKITIASTKRGSWRKFTRQTGQHIWRKRKQDQVNGRFRKRWRRPQISTFCGDARLVRQIHVLTRHRLLPHKSFVPAKLQDPRPSPSFTKSSMEAVRITSWYRKFNGSHFCLQPSSICRITGWVVTQCEPWRIWTAPDRPPHGNQCI